MIGSKRIFFLAAPVILMLGSTPHGATAQCPSPPPGQQCTAGGVLLPPGWTVKRSDRFGTLGAPYTNIGDLSALHTNYCEGQFYEVVTLDPSKPDYCKAKPSHTTVNHGQQIYVAFKDAITFSDDHLTINAR
jgi:hypothetical protein